MSSGGAMSIADILVVLDGSPRSDTQRDLAIQLAMKYDAHLVGFCPLELFIPIPIVFPASAYAPTLIADLTEFVYAKARKEARSTEMQFREQLRRNGIKGEWVLHDGHFSKELARRAHAIDLVIMGQPDPENPLPPGNEHAVGEVLMSIGRPLLVVPCAGKFETIGRHVLLGWNGSREATRAVHDALPLIQPDGKLTLLSIIPAKNAANEADLPTMELAEHLSRYHIKVAADRSMIDDKISVADALLNYVYDNAADLLVIGGYGHSPIWEAVFGGVTRTILEQMTVPTLISH
jgi:nucleotide-binding universal stress UspA family protein